MSSILTPHDPQTAREYYRAGLWQQHTLYALMPEYYLVVTEFPLTASGKILKRELVAWAKDGRIQPHPCRAGGAETGRST